MFSTAQRVEMFGSPDYSHAHEVAVDQTDIQMSLVEPNAAIFYHFFQGYAGWWVIHGARG